MTSTVAPTLSHRFCGWRVLFLWTLAAERRRGPWQQLLALSEATMGLLSPRMAGFGRAGLCLPGTEAETEAVLARPYLRDRGRGSWGHPSAGVPGHTIDPGNGSLKMCRPATAPHSRATRPLSSPPLWPVPELSRPPVHPLALGRRNGEEGLASLQCSLGAHCGGPWRAGRVLGTLPPGRWQACPGGASPGALPCRWS